VNGGECIVKQYVHFTHVCSVDNYLPNIDYCCCVHDAGLLCCRYYQSWNHFRCVESDDLVDTLYVTFTCLNILMDVEVMCLMGSYQCRLFCLRIL